MADFTLSSSAFGSGEPIPVGHSCEGEDRSPPLRWSDAPPDAGSLALVLDDPDAPGGTFTHWLGWGIDPAANGLGEGEAAAELAGATGRELLVALAVAYQVQCRLSDEAPVRDRGFDHTVQGAYAAAAAAAKALRLDAGEIANAVAIAGTSLNALRVTRTGALSHWKGLAYPAAAFGAVHAALIARFPAEHACRLRIVLRDGRELTAEKADYLGFRTRPMGWDDALAKFELLAGGRAPAGLAEAVERLEEVEAAELCALLERVRAA